MQIVKETLEVVLDLTKCLKGWIQEMSLKFQGIKFKRSWEWIQNAKEETMKKNY